MPYLVPKNADEALAHLAHGPARIVAGCTDYYPSLAPGAGDGTLLDISRVAGFRGVTRIADGWRIGPATTWTDIIRADLPAAFDGLKLAAREVGSVQIQNRATVVGNLCNASPAADGVPPLLVLEAGVEIRGAGGRRVVPLGAFITGVRRTVLEPGEMVTGLLIPDPPVDSHSHFQKLGSRTYLVISIAMVAVLVRSQAGRVAEARVAVGSCAPVAQRLASLETRLVGLKHGDIAALGIGAEDLAPLSPITDVRGTAAYRADTVATLIRRALGRALTAEGV